GAGGEIRAVNISDGVGAGDDEELRAAIVLRPAIVVRREAQIQYLGAHRAVVDEDPAAGFVEIAALYRRGDGALAAVLGMRSCAQVGHTGRMAANVCPIVHAFARSCFRTLMLSHAHAFARSCFRTLMLSHAHAFARSCFRTLMLSHAHALEPT